MFNDSKCFVDAVAKRAPQAVLRDFESLGDVDTDALRAFVVANFELPVPAAPKVRPAFSISQYIAANWVALERAPVSPLPWSSALALPRPFVVPGGRFRELYYWDSYFTMLGLSCDGRADLVEAMIDNFTTLIECHGYVPNGTRTYYLGRSQPPVFYLMVGLSRAGDRDVRRRRLAAMQVEHEFWMRGAKHLRPGELHERAVRMPDGALLNRYWDADDTPREEAWYEDVTTARQIDRNASHVYRDLRAAAESGWDFSSRWLRDPSSLASIRTTSILPVDLNSLLYGLEQAIAVHARALDESSVAARFAQLARSRRRAIQTWLWAGTEARFADLDLENLRPTPSLNAASLFPLFTRIANARQARAMEALVRTRLLAPGGLVTTTVHSGEQWDKPNGWAPLQWISIAGFAHFGRHAIAKSIATRWKDTVERGFALTGELFEKYDVERHIPGGGGEYCVQEGFGWTNGVSRMIDRLLN